MHKKPPATCKAYSTEIWPTTYSHTGRYKLRRTDLEEPVDAWYISSSGSA